MGKVGMIMTVTLEADANIDSVKEELMNISGMQADMKIEPVGFGIQSIKIIIVREDKEGGDTDAIEEQISGISGVGSVRTDDVTLI